MGIVFILILISALSSYLILVNDQLAHSYDIVVQIEKNFKSFYETEFVIYYILDFYQHNNTRIELPYKHDFELYCSAEQKNLKVSVDIREVERDITLLITIHKVVFHDADILVNCHLFRENNDLIKFKNYQIKKTIR